MANNKRPSILLVSFRYPPETGAAATRLEALTTRWASLGHEVTVLTTTPDYPDGEVYDGYSNEWLQREQRGGVDVVTTKSLPSSPSDHIIQRAVKYVWFTLFATLVGTLWLDRRDVVLATSPQPFAGLAGLAIARLQGVPFVFEIRDLWPESLVAMGEVDNWLVITILDAMSDYLYRKADRISITAPSMKEVVVEAGANPEDVWIHTNGIDHTFFNPNNANEVDESALFDENFVLSYVGTVGKAQGLEVVLEVAKRLQDLDGYSDVRFVFIGFGSRYNNLAKRAENDNLDNIVFLGRRSKSEIPDYLHASDAAFIHTAGEEAFETMIPMKLYEALGAGLPVVLGARGDAVEVLDRANAGIVVTPGDADEILAAVLELHNDSEQRWQYAENGRQYVEKNHSWNAIATEYSENLSRIATR
jgi:glycosyltransferase involved in cell wall biosynthesis